MYTKQNKSPDPDAIKREMAVILAKSVDSKSATVAPFGNALGESKTDFIRVMAIEMRCKLKYQKQQLPDMQS